MKKAAAIVLLILFLIPAIGIHGTVHFCGGEFASITINGIGSKEKCGCGSAKMAGDCCNDEDFSFQLEDDQYKPRQLSLSIGKSIDFSPAFITQVSFSYISPFIQEGLYNAHHPPDDVKTPLYILHQVFII